MSIRPDQIKAARALLGWTQENLGDRIGVIGSTISSYERGKISGSHFALSRLRNVLIAAGVDFIGEGLGVRLREAKQVTDQDEPAITPEQLREALRLLGWSTVRFGLRLKISDTTISSFINDGFFKRAFKPADARASLEAVGVVFTADTGDGSRLSLRKAMRGPGNAESQIRERLPPIERAFELARSGTVRTVDEIKKILNREGYVASIIEGRTLHRQLRALIAAAKPVDAAVAIES